MAGVGRSSDFGKPDFSNEDIENRQDTVDPLVDESCSYEENVKKMIEKGLSKAQACKRVDMAILAAKKSKERRKGLLYEQTAFREEIGDLESCKVDDKSCVPVSEKDEKRGANK